MTKNASAKILAVSIFENVYPKIIFKKSYQTYFGAATFGNCFSPTCVSTGVPVGTPIHQDCLASLAQLAIPALCPSHAFCFHKWTHYVDSCGNDPWGNTPTWVAIPRRGEI